MASLLGRTTVRRLVVIAGLSAVAFTAPLLDLYGKNPEVFVANRTETGQIFLFGFGVALVVPLVCWAILAIANAIGERTASITYQVLIASLAVGTGLVVSRQAVSDSTLLAVLLTLAIAGFVFWVVRTLDTVFIVAAVAVPVLVFMFLGTSATAGLIWTEPEPVEAASNVGSPSNIVMLQLDEFPVASIVDSDGTVNENLFPNFARLAETGTWYRNALSTSIATTQSVPAILTGRRGGEDLSQTYADHPDNLFTLLGDSYDMHVIEWVAELCPEETCPDYAGRAPARFSNLLKDVGVVYGHLTLPSALRDRLPSIDNSWKGFLGQEDTPVGTGVEVSGLPVPPDPQRADWVNWVQRLINGIDADRPPTLSYAHLEAPHVPWVLNPSGTQYVRPEEYTEVQGVEGDGHWGPDPDAALLGFQRHLYQLGFLDKLIGRLLDHIEDTGTWDDTMVVVVADHGASFEPGEHRRWPYENNRDDLYRIPLFVKYPGQTVGETVDVPAFGTDVLPTIVDALDVDTDWVFDGESLLEVDEERPHEPLRWCCNGDGVSTDLQVLFDQVERNHQWVPDQTSWLGVAAVGPYRRLVGSTTDELDTGFSPDLQWSLDLGSDLGDVDVSSGTVQTLVTGRLEMANGDPE
ncbi:MAG: sulfatase-like hydrolase/transferase, partial [Acidimicrobiia bacterium]